MAAPEPVRRAITAAGVATARPFAFLIVGAYAVLWAAFDPASLNWHGVATLATWLMTLFIQRAEHRDTQAMQAKLDELLRCMAAAPDDLAGIDREEPEEIEAHRDRRS
jgi:low affinity Fe/Cu permease